MILDKLLYYVVADSVAREELDEKQGRKGYFHSDGRSVTILNSTRR